MVGSAKVVKGDILEGKVVNGVFITDKSDNIIKGNIDTLEDTFFVSTLNLC